MFTDLILKIKKYKKTPLRGVEPRTYRLTAWRSAAELQGLCYLLFSLTHLNPLTTSYLLFSLPSLFSLLTRSQLPFSHKSKVTQILQESNSENLH